MNASIIGLVMAAIPQNNPTHMPVDGFSGLLIKK
jgi:hypothetical protein